MGCNKHVVLLMCCNIKPARNNYNHNYYKLLLHTSTQKDTIDHKWHRNSEQLPLVLDLLFESSYTVRQQAIRNISL